MQAENPNNVPNADNLGGGSGDAEDINQYYDDAGETFLPADHVSTFERKFIQFNLTMCRLYLASHGTLVKRPYKTIDRCS